MQVTVKHTPDMTDAQFAKAIRTAGFHAVDHTRRGDPTLVIPANAAIDLMIAYEDAIQGDTGNLSWALGVMVATARKQREYIEKLYELIPKNSPLHDERFDPYSAWVSEHSEEDTRKLATLISVALGT